MASRSSRQPSRCRYDGYCNRAACTYFHHYTSQAAVLTDSRVYHSRAPPPQFRVDRRSRSPQYSRRGRSCTPPRRSRDRRDRRPSPPSISLRPPHEVHHEEGQAEGQAEEESKKEEPTKEKKEEVVVVLVPKKKQRIAEQKEDLQFRDQRQLESLFLQLPVATQGHLLFRFQQKWSDAILTPTTAFSSVLSSSSSPSSVATTAIAITTAMPTVFSFLTHNDVWSRVQPTCMSWRKMIQAGVGPTVLTVRYGLHSVFLTLASTRRFHSVQKMIWGDRNNPNTLDPDYYLSGLHLTSFNRPFFALTATAFPALRSLVCDWEWTKLRQVHGHFPGFLTRLQRLTIARAYTVDQMNEPTLPALPFTTVRFLCLQKLPTALFLAAFPSLIHLEIKDVDTPETGSALESVATLTQLTHLSLAQPLLPDRSDFLTFLPNSLTALTLVLQRTAEGPEPPQVAWHEHWTKLTNLTSLNLQNDKQSAPKALDILKHLPRLNHLRLLHVTDLALAFGPKSKLPDLTTAEFQIDFKSPTNAIVFPPTLQHLRLSNENAYTAEDMVLLSKAVAEIRERLSLNIESAALPHLVIHNLQRLDLFVNSDEGGGHSPMHLSNIRDLHWYPSTLPPPDVLHQMLSLFRVDRVHLHICIDKDERTEVERHLGALIFPYRNPTLFPCNLSSLDVHRHPQEIITFANQAPV